MRLLLALPLTLALSACDALSPPRYPDLSGTWALTATIDGTAFGLTGSIELHQPSRRSDSFGGTTSLLFGDHAGQSWLGPPIRDGRVDASGALEFWFAWDDIPWRFTGILGPDGIAGTHELRELGGAWRAERR